jgi:sulfur-carrier protein
VITTTVAVRYFAAARAAAGVEAEKIQVPSDATVAELLDAVRAEHGPELARVLARCSYLLDEVAVRDHGTPIAGATSLDVLPPFAGG